MNLVVTVPKWFWQEWLYEGDVAGDPYTGEEWGFFLGGNKPPIGQGDRLYIVAYGRLRGYAPVTRLGFQDGKWVICRRGNAVAVTLSDESGLYKEVRGFQGFRKVWWQSENEIPFPDWKTENTPL